MIGGRGPVRSARVVRYRGERRDRVRDALAVEEPLEIRVSWRGGDGATRTEPLAVTMRTPGDDFDLVAGFLHGEGVVRTRDDLVEMTYCRGGEATQEYNVVEARLASGASFDPERLRRNFYASSSCGVCGKASLDSVEAIGCRPLEDDVRIPLPLLPALPARLRARQDAFERTGGLHAAGLFDAEGAALCVREDVGRHNAVDKVIGHRARADRLPVDDRMLLVSGRIGFEIVQKARMAGIPVLAGMGAASTLAVDLAADAGMALIGFLRSDRYTRYV